MLIILIIIGTILFGIMMWLGIKVSLKSLEETNDFEEDYTNIDKEENNDCTE